MQREILHFSCCVGGLCFCGGRKTRVHCVCLALIVRVSRWLGIFLWAEITSFTWAVVRRVWWENAPGNKVLDFVVFEGPDVFAEFGGVSAFSMAEWCSVVSVSCFEVFLCESYVRFCRVVVFACDGGLVNYRWLKNGKTENAVTSSGTTLLLARTPAPTSDTNSSP